MRLLHTLEINSTYTVAEDLAELQYEIVKFAGLAIHSDVTLKTIQLDNEAYEIIVQFKEDIKQLRKEAKNKDLHQLVLHSIQSQIEKLTVMLNECIITELEKEAV